MSSPYQPPPAFQQFSSPIVQSGAHPMQPLHSAAGWLKFLGWFNIIIGVLYALTIVGIIIAWLPLWIGFCLKNAGDSLSNGFPNNGAELYKASTNLATVIRIAGVLLIINLAILALYVCAIILIIIVAALNAGAR